ncbi:50S ribosomal protein L23 [Mariniphaga sediminis]|jgi:large subunit ribosomal protein L23|uniref:Large ribosomal subunit protein uL23 n=1 Tax=Mariniphaga sediminis TaxID=1628158 RepID=A0A399CZV9_9BACT|nr:50S ribosomal protein L23 [Mariniphaga sediminis]RIH65134.1 50S ribosomal protein L23 [Mariniphaga sediminis]
MDILVKPLVTEKMNEQAERFNRYGFIVDKKATKPQIKKAVEGLYNVTVDSVNTIVYGGKVKSRYTKSGVITGRTAAYKKAIVTLAEGDSIDFYSNI